MGKGIVTPLITIGLTEDKKLSIVGPLHDKTECVLILADALRMVATFQPPEEKKPSLTLPGAGELVIPGGA